METGHETHAEDPSSERWLEYYRDAKARRRARGPQMGTREQARKYRQRQTGFLISGFLTVGVLVALFYFVLEH